MPNVDLNLVTEFINRNIDDFHQSRVRLIQNLKLKDILRRKNPYLFRARHITSASELVGAFVEATLSSSEEGLFGRFLEDLAIFINQIACNGQKSSAPGIDLEFNRDNTRYLVAVKSGPNWGNSSQHRALVQNFKNAGVILRQSRQVAHVQAVLGICYGKARDTDKGDYQKICGQSFWAFISDDVDLYTKIIEPLGFESERHNDLFLQQKAITLNRLVQEFTTDFCDASGQIDWKAIIEFNSKNLK